MNKILFIIALILIGIGVHRLYSQPPTNITPPTAPVPALPQSVLERMAARSIGSQNPYTSIQDVRVTNTVTTIYDLSYLRAIRIQTITNSSDNVVGFISKTNWVLMDTNLVSSTTNTTPITPR